MFTILSVFNEIWEPLDSCAVAHYINNARNIIHKISFSKRLANSAAKYSVVVQSDR
jgi:hypothetical protein